MNRNDRYKDSCQGIAKIILTFNLPPVSSLRRNTGGFANSFTVDRIMFPPFFHLMQLRAVVTSDAHHWLDISSVVVEIVQGVDDGLIDSLVDFNAYGSNGRVSVFREFGIKIDFKMQRMEFQGYFIPLRRGSGRSGY